MVSFWSRNAMYSIIEVCVVAVILGFAAFSYRSQTPQNVDLVMPTFIDIKALAPNPANCSATWGAYGPCSAPCGGGTATSTYIIQTLGVSNATMNGTLCPLANGTVGSQPCNTAPCSSSSLGAACASQCSFFSFSLAGSTSNSLCSCPTLTFTTTIILTGDTSWDINAGQILLFGNGFSAIITYVLIFTGFSSTVKFDIGSTFTVQNSAEFRGPDVIFAGLFILAPSASGSVTTLTLTSGSLTMGGNAQLVIGFNCVFFVNGGTFSTSNATLRGNGYHHHKAGRAFHYRMTIVIKFIIGILTSQERRTSPSPAPVAYLCGVTAAQLILAGTADVDMSCTSATVTASMVATNLTIQSGGVLWLGNVTSTVLPVVLNGPFVWLAGGWLSVETISQPASGTYITLIQFASTAASCLIPSGVNAEVSAAAGTTLTGTNSIVANVGSVSGTCLIQVYSTVTTNTSTGGGSTGVVSGSTFTIVLNRDCTIYTAALILSYLGRFYTTSRITVTTACGSTIMSFVCTGSSVSDANSYCQTIYNDIMNPNSALFALLNPAVSSTSGGSSSNNGLYGLLALIALPVIIIIVVVIILMRPKPIPEETAYTNEDEDAMKAGAFQPAPYASVPMMNVYNAPPGTPYPTPTPTPMYRP